MNTVQSHNQFTTGVSIVFSRVIPLEADPRSHPLWRLAEQYGCACSEAASDATTHIVATHGGTEKVRLCILHVIAACSGTKGCLRGLLHTAPSQTQAMQTHTQLHTIQVMWAKERGKYVVSPAW